MARQAAAVWLLWLAAVAGCCKTCPPPQVVTTPAAQCLTAPPPAPPPLTFAACPGFEACLSLQDAAALALYERTARGWMAESWVRCGPTPVVAGASYVGGDAKTRTESTAAGGK